MTYCLENLFKIHVRCSLTLQKLMMTKIKRRAFHDFLPEIGPSFVDECRLQLRQKLVEQLGITALQWHKMLAVKLAMQQ